MIRAFLGLLLGLGLSSTSLAVPVDGNGVQYAFQGTVASISGSLGTCCDLAFDVGDPVTGVISLGTSGGGQRIYSFLVDLPLGGQIGTGTVSPVVLDGAPGSTDRIFVFSTVDGDWNALVHLQPGFILGRVEGGFDLIDLGGTAWSGVNPRTGDFPPDYAPDVSVFETAEVFFNISTFESVGGGQQGGTIHIQLTALDVPEPSVAALAFAVLALLGPVRQLLGIATSN